MHGPSATLPCRHASALPNVYDSSLAMKKVRAGVDSRTLVLICYRNRVMTPHFERRNHMLMRTWGPVQFGGPWISVAPTSNGRSPTTAPPIDLSDGGDHYFLTADMPGLSPEHIEVMVENGRLIIAGSREVEHQPQPKTLIRERRPVRFHRQVDLGDAVDSAAIEARYQAGVLEVKIPKRAELQPRTIPVTVSDTKKLKTSAD